MYISILLKWNRIYQQIPDTSCTTVIFENQKAGSGLCTLHRGMLGCEKTIPSFDKFIKCFWIGKSEAILKTLKVNSLTEVSKGGKKEAFWLEGISHAFTTDLKHSEHSTLKWCSNHGSCIFSGGGGIMYVCYLKSKIFYFLAKLYFWVFCSILHIFSCLYEMYI